MNDANEAELVRAIRAGDRRACAALIEAHYTDVYRFLRHLTRDTHDAEDLTQETFAVVWRRAGTFAGRSSLRTWLHRIAYSKFLDARRGRRREEARCRALACGEPAGPGPDETLGANDQARLLAATVARLDEADRCLIVLHYFQDMSYRDMAEVLGEPAGTVKWRTSRALVALRALLGAEVKPHE